MSKIILSSYVSLDGVMGDPVAWTGSYWNDEIEKFQYNDLFASDALLLGRVTYEGFASSWPSMTDDGGFANRINSMPKYVASRTLEKVEWNASLIKGNIAEEVIRLKQQPNQNMLIYGCANFVETLMQHNLIDEYHLLVFPVVVGSGQRLFSDKSKAALKLINAQPFRSGVVALIYQPAQTE